MSLIRILSRSFTGQVLKEKLSTNINPVRNTWIVKRKIKPPLSRMTAKRPRMLKAKHFIYETVEDTDLTPPNDLHVVLTTFVEGIGDVGDVISVDPYYARDHLLLPRLAEYATTENIDKYTKMKQDEKRDSKHSSINSALIVKNLSKIVVPVFMNSENPWTIEKSHIRIAFRMEGYNVPEEAIELPATPISGPDPAKEAADFAVIVTVNNFEQVPVRCRLFYITYGLEIKLTEDYYLTKGEPILEEQKELLEKMPMPEILDDLSQSISLVEKYNIKYLM